MSVKEIRSKENKNNKISNEEKTLQELQEETLN